MHYKPLVERKAHIQKLLKKLNLDSEFILQFDREEITELYKKYNLNKEKWNHQLKFTKSIFLNNKLIDTNASYPTTKRQLLDLFNKFYTIFFFVFCFEIFHGASTAKTILILF